MNMLTLKKCGFVSLAAGVAFCTPVASAATYTLASDETWDDSTITAMAASYDGVSIASGTTLTVDNADAATFPFAMDGAGVFVKDGAGTLMLSGASTFTGEIGVSNGVLKTLAGAAKAATYLGTPSLVTVADGASLDVSEVSTWNQQTTLGTSSPLHIAGTGYSGAGALIRATGANGNATAFGALYLDADASFVTGASSAPHLYLQGHELSMSGGILNLFFGISSLTPGDTGSLRLNRTEINLQGDTWSAADSTFLGDSGNVLHLGSGSKVTLARKKSAVEWSLSVEGDATMTGSDFTQSGVSYPSFNTWAGPIAISNRYVLTLAAGNAQKRLNISGAIAAEDGGWIKKTGLGLVELTGGITLGNGNSNQNVEYGRLHMDASSGTLRVKDGTSLINAIYSTGGRLEFIDTAVTGPSSGAAGFYQRGTSFSDPAYIYGSNTTFVATGRYWSVADMDGSVGILDLDNGSTAGAWGFSLGGMTSGTPTITSYGAVYQRPGSTFAMPSKSPRTMHMASGVGSYAYWGLLGGSCDFPTFVTMGSAGFAFFRQAGGTFNHSANSCSVVSNGGEAVVWQTGGTASARHAFIAETPAGARFTLAVEGSGTSYKFGSGTWSDRLNFCCQNAVTAILAANDGGIMKTVRFDRTSGSMDNGRLYMSFNGGGVQPQESSDICNGSTYVPDGVFVHSGGIVWDTSVSKVAESQYGSIISCPLQAPTGKIVSAIALPTDEGFASEKYIGSPKVTINGNGVAAAAVAVFDEDTRTVTGIHIVAPGSGYGDDTTATIESADRKSAYVCAVTMADAPTTGAGLRKTGDGLLRLTGANTWHGPVTVEKGTLFFDGELSMPQGAGLVVQKGAVIKLGSFERTVSSVAGSGEITGSRNLTVTGSLDLMADASSSLTVTSPLTLADGVEVHLANSDDVVAGETYRFKLLDASAGITCAGALTLPDLGPRWAVNVRSTSISINRRYGTSVVFR